MSKNKKTEAGRLHHFSGPDIIDWLKKGYLPLAPGTPLASPFVHFPEWHQGSTAPLDQETLDEEWLRQYEALPETVRGLLSFDHFRAQGGAIEEDIRAAARRRQGEGLAQFDIGWLGQGRLLRLFPSALCYYGWHYLAAGFSGVALVLNSGHANFASSRERPSKLAPVRYGEPYAFKVTSDNPFPGLLEDHHSQRDNQEWRLLTPVRTALKHQGQPVLPISRGMVEAIYWSVATEEATVEAIRTLVRQDMRYKSIGLGQVVPDIHRWTLSLVPE